VEKVEVRIQFNFLNILTFQPFHVFTFSTKKIMARSLALKINSEETPQKSTLRIEKAAENVSNELDKIIHERMRLGIISALAANETLSFTELKNLLNTTDGNISVHSRKLEEAGYLTCEKSFKGRVPLTEYRITNDGREALNHYLNHMEALINAMKGK
jgi:DNA-binding transcriptional ArsR family regulator